MKLSQTNPSIKELSKVEFGNAQLHNLKFGGPKVHIQWGFEKDIDKKTFRIRVGDQEAYILLDDFLWYTRVM